MSSSNDPGTDLGRLILQGEGITTVTRIAEGIFLSPGISNSYLIQTRDGDVAVNTGSAFESEHHKARYAEVRKGPLRFVIFTQGHSDHIGGAASLAGPVTQIIAQAQYPQVRGYWNRLSAFYGARTRVLWRSVIGDTAGTRAQPKDPAPDIFFEDRYDFDLGQRRFELLSVSGGETTDSLAVWLPHERTVFTGNLFGPIFGHLPNLYTIRGDKIRSALRFVDSLERVRGLEPEVLVTGHGEPIRGKDAISAGLSRIRDATLWVHDRTVEGMNSGKDVHTLMREVDLPEKLRVGQGHGKVSWCVRAIWEEYAGWFHYDSTASLYPVPARAVSPDVVDLAGADALAERARLHVSADRPVEALHLTDMVLDVEETHRGALEVRLASLQRLLDLSGGENFSEVQWLKAAIEETQQALAEG